MGVVIKLGIGLFVGLGVAFKVAVGVTVGGVAVAVVDGVGVNGSAVAVGVKIGVDIESLGNVTVTVDESANNADVAVGVAIWVTVKPPDIMNDPLTSTTTNNKTIPPHIISLGGNERGRIF